MTKITFLESPKFKKELRSFIKKDSIRSKLFNKAITNFRYSPRHPSLNLEKLKGSKIWSIRIDKGNRIFFNWIDHNTVLLQDVGKHDKYRQL